MALAINDITTGHTPITKNAVSRGRTLENLPKIVKELQRRKLFDGPYGTVDDLKRRVSRISNALKVRPIIGSGIPAKTKLLPTGGPPKIKSAIPSVKGSLETVTPQLRDTALALADSKSEKSQLAQYIDRKYRKVIAPKIIPPKQFGTTIFDPNSSENSQNTYLFRGVTTHEKAKNVQGLGFGGGYQPGAVHASPDLHSAKDYGETLPGGKLTAIYEANPKGQNYTADWGIEQNLSMGPKESGVTPPLFARNKQDIANIRTKAPPNAGNLFYETLVTPKHNKLIGFGIPNADQTVGMIPANDEKGVSSLIRNLLHKRRNSKMTVADTFPSLVPSVKKVTTQKPKHKFDYKILEDIESKHQLGNPELISQLAQDRVTNFVDIPSAYVPNWLKQPWATLKASELTQ